MPQVVHGSALPAHDLDRAFDHPVDRLRRRPDICRSVLDQLRSAAKRCVGLARCNHAHRQPPCAAARALAHGRGMRTAAASIVDLDLNPNRQHGICMPRRDQVSATPKQSLHRCCRASAPCGDSALLALPTASVVAVGCPASAQLPCSHHFWRGSPSRYGWTEILSLSGATAAT